MKPAVNELRAENAVAPENPAPRRASWTTTALSWAITVAILGGLGLYLERSKPPALDQTAPPANLLTAVRVASPHQIRIAPGSPMEAKLAVRAARGERSRAPVLEITGSVVASLRRGQGPREARWQFASPELLSAYVEWTKSGADVESNKRVLELAKKLRNARVNAQTKVVERLRKLVHAGSDSPKDLALEEANLLQATLQGQKDVHDAEVAARTSERSRAAFARQLEQAGLDPALLGATKDASGVLVADVPESKAARAHDGQRCRADFYALPGLHFDGQVSRVSRTVSPDKRTLRVLVVLEDGDGKLRPGMFADVGLGTDERTAIRVPADAVLHAGRSDYVLVRVGPGLWNITEVIAGDQQAGEVEILQGVVAGAQVMGAGSILLKPFVVEALARP